MGRTPIPADVYRAAVRIYIGSSTDPESDYSTVRGWAQLRWPSGIPGDPYKVAFWVVSQSAQDGHE